MKQFRLLMIGLKLHFKEMGWTYCRLICFFLWWGLTFDLLRRSLKLENTPENFFGLVVSSGVHCTVIYIFVIFAWGWVQTLIVNGEIEEMRRARAAKEESSA